MLEHLIVATRQAGIREMLLVVGYGERAVREYFGDGSRWGVSIEYVVQRHQKGTAHALAQVQELVHDRFLLLNGDMLLHHEDLSALASLEPPCLTVATTDHPEDYGVVTTEGSRVTGLLEKSPAPPATTINAGAYLLGTDIFPLLADLRPSPRGELELTDALASYIPKGILRAHSLWYWRDVGYPWDLLDANAELLHELTSSCEGIVEDNVILHGPVAIGKGTVVKAGTYIEGPCTIGEECRIGPHAYLRAATSIGDRCHVGHGSEVKNSVIFPDTNLPHFNYVGDSVIGSGCNLGAGATIANLRHDRATVRVGGKDTHRIKFGAILGDNVQLGINCSVNAGSVLGAGVQAAPGTYLDGIYGDGSVVK